MSNTRPSVSAVYIAVTGMELSYLYLGLSMLRHNLGLNRLSMAAALALYILPVVTETPAAARPRIKMVRR